MNRKIIDYKLVASEIENEIGLASNVKSHLLAGWHPIGGAFWDGDDYIQAMVKYEEEPNKETKMEEFTFKPASPIFDEFGYYYKDKDNRWFKVSKPS